MINRRKAGEQAFKLFCTPQGERTVKETVLFANAEKLSFPLEGKLIRGYRCNAGQSKKILILHGFSSNCQNFDRYAVALVQKNYEVLAFDAPAHGASEGQTVNAVEYSDMIKRIHELYGPFNGYLAHSFGGIAVSLALEDINHDKELKLVLIAPATETSSAIDGAFSVLGIKNQGLRQSMDDIIYAISGRNTAWFSIRRAMKNIKADTLWIHDDTDDVTPIRDVYRVKEDNHPHINFMITHGLGHRRIYRDSHVKNKIVDFLSNTVPVVPTEQKT